MNKKRKVVPDEPTIQQSILQICRDDEHQMDSFFTNGKETVFCYQCADFRAYDGQVYFGGQKRYLANNQN